jgi:predicted component of type VI protein secretion system
MQRRLAIAATAVLAVVLSGCSSTSAPATQDPEAPIEIWIRQAPG